LADGLDTATDELALRDLRARFSKRAERTAPVHEDSRYNASDAAPGPARLRAAMSRDSAAAKAAGLGAVSSSCSS
jgi:hypothetical protein